jgi:hypothetical protein
MPFVLVMALVLQVVMPPLVAVDVPMDLVTVPVVAVDPVRVPVMPPMVLQVVMVLMWSLPA